MTQPNTISDCCHAPAHGVRINDSFHNVCAQCYQPCTVSCDHEWKVKSDGDGESIWTFFECEHCEEQRECEHADREYQND